MNYGYKRGLVDGATFWPFPCLVPSSMWEPRRNPAWRQGYLHGHLGSIFAIILLFLWLAL